MPQGDTVARQLEWLRVISETSRAFQDTVTSYEALLRVVAERVAIATGDTCTISLLSESGSLVPVASHAGAAGTGSTVDLTVPLVVRGVEIGTLTLGCCGHRHDEIDRRMIEDLAGRSALAIDNARLFRDLEKRAAARTAELQAANRELETFSYSVSHDLRAPLRAIDGFAKILVEDHGEQLDAEARRVLRVISTNAEKMGVLIDALLAFARVGRMSVAHETTDMRVLAKSASDEVTSRESTRSIEVAIGELPSVQCNADLVRQVWVHLLANAVKFTRPRDRAIISVGGSRVDNEIVYTVQDNGVGFDMKYAGKLFGVFQRMHDAEHFEGIGVGLALVQRIVHRHGGRVWANAAIDKGATFSFALPLESK